MEGKECDIFKFSDSGRLKVGGNLQLRSVGILGDNVLKKDSSTRKRSQRIDFSDSASSSGSDDDGMYARKRSSYAGNLAVSRLLKKKTPNDEVIPEPASVDSTPSPPPCTLSPRPSPPPPGFFLQDTPVDRTCQHVLNQANDVLNRLRYSSPYIMPNLLSDRDVSSFPLIPVLETINLRVRCKGRVHKYNVEKSCPFSNVIMLLSKDLNISDDERMFLSHKTDTLLPTDSPSSRTLTTADIIDAVVMKEADFPIQKESLTDSQGSVSDECSYITIKVQTANKHKVYKISTDDPLLKVMTAFSSELNIPTRQLKFLFDGDVIQPLQAAKDFDMEDDDCIDVMVLKS